MANYVLSCCSTADLSEQHFIDRDIHYICFHYMLDGKNYADDLGKSIPFDQFYQAMVDGAETRTSQVNAEEYAEYFEKFLKEGNKVKVTIRFRGRQIAHSEIGREVMKEFAEKIKEYGVVERSPLIEGRNMFMIISPREAN